MTPLPRRTFAARLGAALLLAGTLGGTPSCEAGTGGRRVMFDLAVEPATQDRAFRTSLGWDVTLSEACVAVGPVYLYANPGLSALHRAYDWLVPSAHAHPGVDHFNGGEVRGEWLEQIAVDLTAGGRVGLGAREGIAGEARSVTIGINPPTPGALGVPTCLRGHQAYVVGSATRDGVTVPFEGGLDIEAVGTKRRLQISTLVTIDDRRELVVMIDPNPWLDQVRFDQLTLGPGESRAAFAPGSQAMIAWELGIQSAAAFRVDGAR